MFPEINRNVLMYAQTHRVKFNTTLRRCEWMRNETSFHRKPRGAIGMNDFTTFENLCKGPLVKQRVVFQKFLDGY